eukprot:6041603-Pleurochrysis_carterae.AAC.1
MALTARKRLDYAQLQQVTQFLVGEVAHITIVEAYIHDLLRLQPDSTAIPGWMSRARWAEVHLKACANGEHIRGTHCRGCRRWGASSGAGAGAGAGSGANSGADAGAETSVLPLAGAGAAASLDAAALPTAAASPGAGAGAGSAFVATDPATDTGLSAVADSHSSDAVAGAGFNAASPTLLALTSAVVAADGPAEADTVQGISTWSVRYRTGTSLLSSASLL